jgi:hypothetical protein
MSGNFRVKVFVDRDHYEELAKKAKKYEDCLKLNHGQGKSQSDSASQALSQSGSGQVVAQDPDFLKQVAQNMPDPDLKETEKEEPEHEFSSTLEHFPKTHQKHALSLLNDLKSRSDVEISPSGKICYDKATFNAENILHKALFGVRDDSDKSENEFFEFLKKNGLYHRVRSAHSDPESQWMFLTKLD